MKEKTELAIELINGQIEILDKIVQEVRQDSNYNLASERLERWKVRTVKFLLENVNRAEARRFSRKRLAATHLTNALQNILDEYAIYKSALLALCEEIENHPEHVFYEEPSQEHEKTKSSAKEGLSYDVAFSFAGEKRDYIKQVAKHLRGEGIQVFYDEYEEVEMWGNNMIDYLHDVLKNKSKHCVMFISKEYTEKVWPDFERQIIEARGLVEKGYLLPARFDDTPVKGLPDTVKWIDISSRTPEEFAKLIVQKVSVVKKDSEGDQLEVISPESKDTASANVFRKETDPALHVLAIRESGGPSGHFSYFKIKNVGVAAALDVRWEVRGFGYRWVSSDDLFELGPGMEKELTFPIGEETIFTDVKPELNIVLEYKDIEGKSYFVRRELEQKIVKSGAFFDLRPGVFHAPELHGSDDIDFYSGPTQNGDRTEVKFKVKSSGKIIIIGVSETFLTTWRFSNMEEKKQALLELGFRKLNRMGEDGSVSDFIFTTDKFPRDYQEGFRGYQMLRDSL